MDVYTSNLCCSFSLVDFWTMYRFIEGDFDAYVRRMRLPHTWGGEPELLMLSNVLRQVSNLSLKHMRKRALKAFVVLRNLHLEYVNESFSIISMEMIIFVSTVYLRGSFTMDEGGFCTSINSKGLTLYAFVSTGCPLQCTWRIKAVWSLSQNTVKSLAPTNPFGSYIMASDTTKPCIYQKTHPWIQDCKCIGTHICIEHPKLSVCSRIFTDLDLDALWTLPVLAWVLCRGFYWGPFKRERDDSFFCAWG